MLEKDSGGSPACLRRRRKQQVGSGKTFFKAVPQTCFAYRSSPSWKGINEREKYLSFPPGNKVPVFPGASKTLWQEPAPEGCGANKLVLPGALTESGPRCLRRSGPLSSSHLCGRSDLCSGQGRCLTREGERALLLQQENSDVGCGECQ